MRNQTALDPQCSTEGRDNSYSSLHTQGQTLLFTRERQLSQGRFCLCRNDHSRHPLHRKLFVFLTITDTAYSQTPLHGLHNTKQKVDNDSTLEGCGNSAEVQPSQRRLKTLSNHYSNFEFARSLQGFASSVIKASPNTAAQKDMGGTPYASLDTWLKVFYRSQTCPSAKLTQRDATLHLCLYAPFSYLHIVSHLENLARPL